MSPCFPYCKLDFIFLYIYICVYKVLNLVVICLDLVNSIYYRLSRQVYNNLHTLNISDMLDCQI